MNFSFKHALLLLLAVPSLAVEAQEITPVTRFYAQQSPYVTYSDEFLSGFMQQADNRQQGGFLQLPFVGNPVLVYVGEKDSTQFMAYASGYEFHRRQPEIGRYAVDYTRYGVKARVESHPGYAVQHFTFPDTTAAKGFLVDIDNCGSGEGNEDMNVYFIDKRTIRAYKRSTKAGSTAPDQYYYARFSHPFDSWNVRRERVTLKDGSKEYRCKAAFTFKLKDGEDLTVRSAVSAFGSNEAYAMVEGRKPSRPFDDKRYVFDGDELTADAGTPLVAQRRPESTASKSAPAAASKPKASVKTQPATGMPAPVKRPATAATAGSPEGVPYIEITTKEAELRAAFFAAVDRLMQRPELKKAANADEFLTRLASLYHETPEEQQATPVETDSLIRRCAKDVILGSASGEADVVGRAAWFVFNALGFTPEREAAEPTYRLRRPVFNVVTLTLPKGRRMILHTKNNAPHHPVVASATLVRQPLAAGNRFSRLQMLKGGVMQLQMMEMQK